MNGHAKTAAAPPDADDVVTGKLVGLLRGGPRSLAELASEVGVHHKTVERVLNASNDVMFSVATNRWRLARS